MRNAGNRAVAGMLFLLMIMLNSDGGLSERDIYKGILYEKYLESLEKSRKLYLELLNTAKQMNIEKSPWIDSACVRIKEIDKILGDRKDTVNCISNPGKDTEKK